MRNSRRAGEAKWIVIAVIALIAIIACYWYLSKPATQPDVDEGRVVADTFFTQIQNDQAVEAWQSTTAEFKSADGREAFLRLLKRRPFLQKPLEFESSKTITLGEEDRTEYVFNSPDAPNASIRVVIASESDTWKVDRLVVEPKDTN
ncbi:hypothetical protein [Thalassoroseus pseudoceratinae]|uniref:hypothetical protein n=1 Tax=Thalassoroseus pseudoceratinae TaxID=2713176 RepID=UPI001423221B|nr:hypothetical protein [Thalassoroseus pseudoceratinae]